VVLVSLYMGMRLWQFKIKQYRSCRETDLTFLLSVILLLPSILPSSVRRWRFNTPGRREIGLVETAAWKLLFIFQLLFCRPADLQTTWCVHRPALRNQGKMPAIGLSATSTKAVSWGLNNFMGNFCFCSVEKAFSSSVRECISLSTTSWIGFCNFNWFYSKISQQFGQKENNSSFPTGS